MRRSDTERRSGTELGSDTERRSGTDSTLSAGLSCGIMEVEAARPTHKGCGRIAHLSAGLV
jgi:hypothetical protein